MRQETRQGGQGRREREAVRDVLEGEGASGRVHFQRTYLCLTGGGIEQMAALKREINDEPNFTHQAPRKREREAHDEARKRHGTASLPLNLKSVSLWEKIVQALRNRTALSAPAQALVVLGVQDTSGFLEDWRSLGW
eukprot:3598441-Rhodomonas_salina.1